MDAITSRTIVKLREGDPRDVPLILMHGGDGSISAFKAVHRKLTKGTLWAIQLTPETPLHESMDAWALFYYSKIKEERPKGPYRFAAFSGSAILLTVLAHLFSAGEIIQLAFIDNFPTTFFAPIIGLGEMPLRDAQAKNAFTEAILKLVVEVTRRDAGGSDPKRHRRADTLENICKALLMGEDVGADVDEFTKTRLLKTIEHTYRGYEFITDSIGCETLEDFEAWLKGLCVDGSQVTVFVAENGVIASIPVEQKEKWRDFGVRRCFPEASVVHVKGAGHFDMLGNDIVVNGLEVDPVFPF